MHIRPADGVEQLLGQQLACGSGVPEVIQPPAASRRLVDGVKIGGEEGNLWSEDQRVDLGDDREGLEKLRRVLLAAVPLHRESITERAADQIGHQLIRQLGPNAAAMRLGEKTELLAPNAQAMELAEALVRQHVKGPVGDGQTAVEALDQTLP